MTTKLIVCDVLKDEVAALCAEQDLPPPAEADLLEMGLHDQPDNLRATLQQRIDAVAAAGDVDAIVLVYARCGNGTVGLRAPEGVSLVIPRAHDCVTIFLGDRHRYEQFQKENTGTYFFTPGWQREKRVPGPDRLEKLRADYAEKFDDEDDIDFLLETERTLWDHYRQVAYVDLDHEKTDTCADCDYAKRCAEWLGWEFAHLQGDPQLLRDLLTGPWDEDRFLVVPPGHTIKACEAGQILKVSA